MNKTNIEYLDFTWNPLAMRCTPVSEGCANCWHLKRADMLNSNPKISHNIRLAYGGNAPPILVPERLDDPLKRKKPAIIGVQFMGDLFHEDIPDHQINSVFLTMVKADWHTYLLLTKRPKRMANFISIGTGWRGRMPYVWPGITAENQQTANERIPILLQIPAAKRFVSIEPMLGPVDLCQDLAYPPFLGVGLIDWVIAGGESGPRARPMHPDWARFVRDQCQKAGVPFFFKQWGEYVPDIQYWQGRGILNPSVSNSKIISGEEPCFSLKKPGFNYLRIGKKAAGRLIDDRQWNERP